MVSGNIKPFEPDFKSAVIFFSIKNQYQSQCFWYFQDDLSFGDPEFSVFFHLFNGLSLVKDIVFIYIMKIKK